MPAPKLFQLLHFPNIPSPISARVGINRSLPFCKSTFFFPSQRLKTLSIKSISAGPKDLRRLSEATGGRDLCSGRSN